MCRKDCFYDVVVARAAANVTLELVADGFFIECVVAINHVNRADDHAWRTKSALQPMILAKCFLHGVQLVTVRYSFDANHVGAFELLRQNCA